MILCFGHIYTEFHSALDSPLEPESTIVAKKGSILAGGAAINIGIAAARSGAKVSVGGTIGNDLFADNILNTLRREGIQSTGIAKIEKNTGFKQIITDADDAQTTINNTGANTKTSHDQIADKMLNERTLLVLQNDLPTETNLKLLKRAKQHNARTMMCLINEGKIDDEWFEHCDFVLGDNPISTSRSKAKHIVTKHKSYAFTSFCGTFAACIQAGVILEKAKQYAETAATLAKPQNIPYLGDIEAFLKAKSRA